MTKEVIYDLIDKTVKDYEKKIIPYLSNDISRERDMLAISVFKSMLKANIAEKDYKEFISELLED